MKGIMELLDDFDRAAHALGTYLNQLDEYTAWRQHDPREYIPASEVRSEDYRRQYAEAHLMLIIPDPDLMERLEWDYSMRQEHERNESTKRLLMQYYRARGG